MESVMIQPRMAQNFIFYQPEQRPESRHRFSQPTPNHSLPIVPTLPSTPMDSRPSSSSSSHVNLAPKPLAVAHNFGTMTPAASPRPLAARKPLALQQQHPSRLVLQTEMAERSDNYFPATPPLSSSITSSPRSVDVTALATPMNPMFSGREFEEGKEGCDALELKTEFAPTLQWANLGSPPMTPVYLQSSAPSVSLLSLDSSDNLSNLSCPSLSPSPPPQFAGSDPLASEVFCNPRDLTVDITTPVFASPADFSSFVQTDEPRTFQPACKTDDLIDTLSISPASSFDFSVDSSFSSFDDISELGSDEASLVLADLPALTSTPAEIHSGRSRACTSSTISLDHEAFPAFEDLSSFAPAPHSLDVHDDEHRHKRVRTSTQSSSSTVASMVGFAAETAATTDAGSAAPQQESTAPASNNQTEQTESPAADGPGSPESNEANNSPLPTPANRRGRKQSLTEDPSKTFVCDICSRRFRRQEHLKRHYRSLHTHDKPFECNECGKKFSRSDNLAQHARTHGSGAIVMDLVEDLDMSQMSPGDQAAMAAAMHHHHQQQQQHIAGGEASFTSYGRVLFQVAAEIPGSGSEYSSDNSEADHAGKKKRKRTD